MEDILWVLKTYECVKYMVILIRSIYTFVVFKCFDCGSLNTTAVLNLDLGVYLCKQLFKTLRPSTWKLSDTYDYKFILKKKLNIKYKNIKRKNRNIFFIFVYNSKILIVLHIALQLIMWAVSLLMFKKKLCRYARHNITIVFVHVHNL